MISLNPKKYSLTSMNWDSCDGVLAKVDLVYVGLVGVSYEIAPHAGRYVSEKFGGSHEKYR